MCCAHSTLTEVNSASQDATHNLQQNHLDIANTDVFHWDLAIFSIIFLANASFSFKILIQPYCQHCADALGALLGTAILNLLWRLLCPHSHTDLFHMHQSPVDYCQSKTMSAAFLMNTS